MNTKQPILVIIGLGKDQKPRAAVFAPDDAEAATKAAQLMSLKMAKAETPEAIAITKHLPEGKIYASGKGLLPLVKRELYDKLLKAVTLFDPATKAPRDTKGTDKGTLEAPKPNPALASPQPSLPPAASDRGPVVSPWEAIEPGAIVLAHAKGEGWWECVVLATSKDRRTLTVRYRDFPKLPKFSVPRIAVGVICKIP